MNLRQSCPRFPRGIWASQRFWLVLFVMLLTGLSAIGPWTTGSLLATVCPFCSAVKQTLTEEMLTTDAVVFAKVIGPAKPKGDGANSPTLDLMMDLEVHKVLKGKSLLKEGNKFTAVVPPSFTPGQECLVMGVITDQISWSTPVKMTERSRDYILKLQELPEQGPERVKFFLDYLEDPESLLAYDAYDEFARAPYADVKAIKGDMDHQQLLKWIQDPEVTINRKRLYYTMLGACGSKDDLPLLEKLITSDDKRERAALDALAACYLTLAGEKGVALVEDQYLRNKNAEYVDTYAVVAALRFHGTESDVIPVPRILKALRLLLDRPDIADLVIPDLARWEDWSVMDKLVQMFKDADEDSKWVRVPIVNYLRTCPLPEAEKKIEELKEVDPLSVRRALLFFEVESGLENDEDMDFDKQLDELGKEKQNETDKQPKTKDKSKDGIPKQDENNQVASSRSAAMVAFRPVVGDANRKLVELDGDALDGDALDGDALDGDQALKNDPFAQPIATQFSQPEFPGQQLPFLQVESEEGDDQKEPQIALVSDTTPVLKSVPDGASEADFSESVQDSSRAAAGETQRPDSGQQQVAIRPADGEFSDQRTASLRPASTVSTDRSAPLPGSYTWLIVGAPVLVNVILLVFAWSIFSGTFSRLFC